MTLERKAIATAIFDPGATEGYKGDRTLTEWQTDAVMRALSTAPSGQAPLEGVKPMAFADPAAIRALKGTPATAIYLSKEGSAAYSMALYAIADERWKAQAQQATSVISMIRAMIGEMFGPIANIESEEATLLRGPEAKHDGEAILEALQRVASALLPASAEPVALDTSIRPETQKALDELHNHAGNAAAALARGIIVGGAPASGAVEATHRHKKRGSEYVLLGIGKMQALDWGDLAGDSRLGRYVLTVDMREVAIYRSLDDGSLWVRPREEFEDGRFEALPAAPTEGR